MFAFLEKFLLTIETYSNLPKLLPLKGTDFRAKYTLRPGHVYIMKLFGIDSDRNCSIIP